MRFDVLTLFPEIPRAFFASSIMAKAVEKGIISCNFVNIRDFAFDKHRSCDDLTYGGGAGMLMLPEPLASALDSVNAFNKRVIYVTPSGKPFNQKYAEELSREDELVFICGRYEGIDQRIIDEYVDDEISVGDYVMSSGELAALVIIDAVYRLIDGVISGESLEEESFSDFLLEYPQYTRPRNFRGREVPEVLLSGHHLNIQKWRLKKRIEKTLKNRPELIEKAKNMPAWTKDAEKYFKELENERTYNED
ncbi:tRNA (guanosine(37)-N1)-methyltransferase TrmD [Treponema pedis]|uniref:tRNA (guanine-N(1)-)-methyltransferase n=2 Tax=Treponema pedis TaxID=409322 RepID=S6A530_9SPIR|nr:tRNA (guanosine(37)-N1)-methyltransferase TrmD [Treponema pedis]AGT45036.1 tRNA (guanine-N(1)-)-methyltransferase [Treponema pedis str. T A4]QOW60300.1 tRNA (guanosine(37)-N1)-methyltransferase TrmD [Treponema pedis]QSI05646.1 tRNA (guanosine(37)-N1)-methyltransferase TrmD [Treponema pedis]